MTSGSTCFISHSLLCYWLRLRKKSEILDRAKKISVHQRGKMRFIAATCRYEHDTVLMSFCVCIKSLQ